MHYSGSEPSAHRDVGMPAGRAVWLAYAACLGVASLFLGTIVAAPWLHAHEHPWIAGVFYESFSTICHQIPERSFALWERPMAVCSRCFSIYAGVLAGLLLLPLTIGFSASPPRRRWLVLAVIPAAVDFGLGWLGVLENTFLSRAITGALLGAVSVFYFLPGLVHALASVLGGQLTHGDAHGSHNEETRAD